MPAQFHTTPLLIAQARTAAPTAHTTTTAPTAHEQTEREPSPWFFFEMSMLAFVLIAAIGFIGTRRMRLVPRGLQNFLEFCMEALFGIPEMVMGPRGKQYAPLIATLFLAILVSNLIGLIPGLKAGTASLSVTLALAIVAFCAVQYYGFKAHGIRYLAHFLGPVPAMAILIMPLEIVAEIVRIASLSIRLFGNINGEEQVISALANQISPLAAVLLLPLQVLTIFLQAFVFSLLVAVYISLATEKHDDGHGAATAAAH